MTNRPCPKCGHDNIRIGLTATQNGFAIEAECRDCGQKYIIKHRDAIRKMWNEGYFEEVDDE
jgi:transcription elongation factor Elf1